MGGRFSNVQYNETVDSLLKAMRDTLKNNYYKYSDKPPTPVEYYHINKDASTLDEGSKLAYTNIGEDSPLVYNRIHRMLIYGIDQIATQLSNEDFGMQTNDIEGEGIILPNTIEPLPDDHFYIKYDTGKMLFKVTEVNYDTLENGSNVYKINYACAPDKKETLDKQVVEDYEFLISNVGTEFNPLIKTKVVDYINELDKLIVDLKLYYKRVFYNKKVQTFTFKFCESYFYDPYMIEFLRRNKILEGDGQYIYIQHQTKLDPLFPMNYSKTFFNCLEKKDISHVDGYRHRGVGKLIEDKFVIFANRLEEYWEVFYDYPEGYEALQRIPCFKDEFTDHIQKGELFEVRLTFYNVILKYLYDKDIIKLDLDEIEKIEYENNPTLFYALPCIIFCLQMSLNKLMAEKH